MKTKKCATCKKYLPLDKFYVRVDGYRLIHCRPCDTIRRKKYGKVIHGIIHNAKKRAKKKGLEFNITSKDVLEINKEQKGLCAYSGIALNWDFNSKGIAKRRSPIDRASLDRIDSTKGYTVDNIQVLADLVNRMKHTLSYKELLKFCQLIIDNSTI
ncbi:hypothetical protein LCGC14_1596910 [marine sediment metagenome]|uniref:Uncharacterized protein n=1 Tax=marine sediment metagenome TaxID=412755 RepID=A0A0F9LCM3_9ZZZZ